MQKPKRRRQNPRPASGSWRLAINFSPTIDVLINNIVVKISVGLHSALWSQLSPEEQHIKLSIISKDENWKNQIFVFVLKKVLKNFLKTMRVKKAAVFENTFARYAIFNILEAQKELNSISFCSWFTHFCFSFSLSQRGLVCAAVP